MSLKNFAEAGENQKKSLNSDGDALSSPKQD